MKIVSGVGGGAETKSVTLHTGKHPDLNAQTALLTRVFFSDAYTDLLSRDYLLLLPR